ncbi:hypothetical protein J5N97_027581 [Dioscorea zingiberensis]|uniref:BHLH domain-containing protein n=1 Tax=Dioscorea zingiberensis TaxID=325984 RepID=A0A9D5C4Y5_9LILI|nr:hypothetical protein J5N97_027581 [Dioscorea zingiberensis]
MAAPKPEGDHKEYESSRSYRQMMRERLRRERLSQGYADLHSILLTTSTLTSKGTKNSIVEAAVVYVREQKELMEGLVRRNDELKEEIARDEEKGELKINISVPNASTGIDSLIESLRCLKDLDVKANSIRSEFCGQDGFLVVGVDDSKEAMTEIQSTVESVMEKYWKDGN